MFKLRTQHLLTGEELDSDDVLGIIDFGIFLKAQRARGLIQPLLLGKHLALIFDKPSLRTRFSFTIAMNELGGHSIESTSLSRKREEPEDLARVLSGYCHGIVIRTHADQELKKMASVSSIPIINGLTELHHPCQILADLMALKETFGSLKGLTLSYIGDGNNILHSLLLLCPLAGINLNYSTPKQFQPNQTLLEIAKKRALDYGTRVLFGRTPDIAVLNSHAVYTDVWTSMGFEIEKETRNQAFASFQVNEDLIALAEKNAVVMHCLPMERGKEISMNLPDGPSSIIFRQSENRLHIQKAILVGLINR